MFILLHKGALRLNPFLTPCLCGKPRSQKVIEPILAANLM
jgi:hypothetical protein